MYNDTLQHYGVLGMKWGRRKASRLSNKQKKIAAKKRKYEKISAKRKKLIAKIKESEAKNKNKGKSALKEWVNEVGKTYPYSNSAVGKAHIKSRNEQFRKNWKTNKAKAIGTRLRRELLYTNTNELKDVNRRLKGKRKSLVRSYVYNKVVKRKKK